MLLSINFAFHIFFKIAMIYKQDKLKLMLEVEMFQFSIHEFIVDLFGIVFF